MRVGWVIGVNETGEDRVAPIWDQLHREVMAAEAAGFDIAVLADALTYDGLGFWEAMSMAGAMAAVTSRIELSHSVVNAALRPAPVIAWAATTLDEISGGRYTLGIGAGNTPQDFEDYAIPVDKKFSRFEESLQVIRALLKDGVVDFDGEFVTAHSSHVGPTGPRPQGPPIVVAGRGPRVMRMCARFGDGWNWWGSPGGIDDVREQLADLEEACEDVGRDPATLHRTYDVYSYDILGSDGDVDEVAESILAFGEAGIDEVRCDVISTRDTRIDAAEAMAAVVESVKAG